jgi:hypothetical protein
MTPRSRIYLQKYIKGATIRLDFGAQAENDLHHTKAAEAARTGRNTSSQRRFMGGGVITVKEARQRKKQRALGDAKAEKRRYDSLLKRERKAFFTQFEIATAMVRVCIRRLKLQKHYGLEI